MRLCFFKSITIASTLLCVAALRAQPIENHVDRDAAIELLLETADTWNSGLGAYGQNWNGLFLTDLSRSFVQTNPNADQTVISQSRAIYFNTEAYRVASGTAKTRYLDVVRQGANYLISHAWDAVYGGVFWGLEANGSTPPSSTGKQAYGQVHVIFALCHAYSITGNSDYLEFAWRVFEQFEVKHAEPSRPGAYKPSQTRNYSTTTIENNFDYMLHYFEALLALFDVTVGDQHERVRETLAVLGDFMTQELVQSLAADSAYVSYWYADDWRLHPRAYSPSSPWVPSRFATAGHGIEFAWLLSRASERGFDPGWVDIGRKLLTFARRYGINPNAGGMLYDRLNTNGSVIQPLPSTVEMVWWPQTETARALVHWAALRDENVWTEFDRTDALIRSEYIDPVFGGLYESFDVSNPSLTTNAWIGQADTAYKGSIWKVNYHATMNLAEQIRLVEIQDPLVGSSKAFTDFEQLSDAAATSAEGDFDHDGYPNFLEYAMGSDSRSANFDLYRISYDSENKEVTARYEQSRTAQNVTLVFEWSNDLVTWKTEGIETVETGRDSQTVSYESVVKTDGLAFFTRLRVASDF